MPARGDIEIDERYCLGCGLCEHFCSRGCIVITGKKFTPQGYVQPEFINPEKCTGCAVCSWMCPHFAIKTYKYVEAGDHRGQTS